MSYTVEALMNCKHSDSWRGGGLVPALLLLAALLLVLVEPAPAAPLLLW